MDYGQFLPGECFLLWGGRDLKSPSLTLPPAPGFGQRSSAWTSEKQYRRADTTNTQMMVMSLFAVFWLSFGLLQMPTLGLAAAYSATGNAAEGAASKEYNAVVGLYLIVWGFALFTFWIFTLKTNAVFAGIFGFVTIAAWVLAGAYFKVGSGDYEAAGKLQKVFCISLVLAER